MKKPLVLLFDIDGTLISSGGAARRAIEKAFKRAHGRDDACERIAFGGMTDRAIARGGLEAIGVVADDAAIDALLANYLDGLEIELKTSTSFKVHAGIERALVAAEAREACAIGLGTGNVERGARLKLEKVGLSHRFSFGGFGCDHELRAQVVSIGAQRGAKRLGLSRDECRVVVIGDTPKDIAAAKAIGAESIAVATGGVAIDELRACGPTWAFENLEDERAIDALLAG